MSIPTQDQITIPLELAEAALDNMISLKGEWHWWKDEPRCNYQRDYNLLCAEIQQLEKLINEHKNPGNEA